jgi:hypothetical protein
MLELGPKRGVVKGERAAHRYLGAVQATIWNIPCPLILTSSVSRTGRETIQGRIMFTKDVHILIHRICDYVKLHDKSLDGIAGMIGTLVWITQVGPKEPCGSVNVDKEGRRVRSE